MVGAARAKCAVCEVARRKAPFDLRLHRQVAATTAVAAWSLHGEYDAEKHAMLLLLGAAIYSEYVGADRDPTETRQGITGGAPLGALALPWLFVSRVGGPNFHLFAFWVSVATNVALLPGLPRIVSGGAAVAAVSAGARELNYVNVGHEPYPTEWTIAATVAPAPSPAITTRLGSRSWVRSR